MVDTAALGDLTLKQIVEANLSRVEKWHSLTDWSVLEWAGAMCGEAGEAANFAKKLKRVETDIANNDLRMSGLIVPKEQLVPVYRDGIVKEYADVVISTAYSCARGRVLQRKRFKTRFAKCSTASPKNTGFRSDYENRTSTHAA